ncbi:MAG TPA: hydantoinase/oxoprolinase family protein [Acidimicrobiales bacterium]|nr:hydantoinase/oxoprolinase family protein [Acidimicrobiales bacterium]
MGATINIDTGGTFTDGYFTREGRSERVKVDTTPHDLTECLANCVAEGARKLDYPSVQKLLLDTDVFRFSSTIGTNSIIQRSGPRIGLLVSAGAGDRLYGKAESPLYDFLLRRDLVAEIGDPFDSGEVRSHIRRLLVGGARILVVSFAGSEDDASAEEAVKKVVQTEYPRHYLGAVPCLLASEVTPRPGAERRTSTAVINAYLHPDMVRFLYKADEDLRSEGFPHPLLIVHASGGVARVAKTRAIETYNSGPVGGVFGAARISAFYGHRHLVTMDVGGTSTDVAVLADSTVPFDDNPRVAGVGVHVPMVRVDAVGGGGGSIAGRDDSGYTVGPESAGASPGPACYGLGGQRATATDADIVLGHLDPDWFLGGRRRLDPARARAAIERIAGGDRAEDAAWGVHRALVKVAADRVRSMVAESGTPASEFTLLSFGGGGGLYGAEVAEACGIAHVLSLPQSSVFSAFGISGMDLSHVYELRPGSDLPAQISAAVARAALDAAGEGSDPLSLSYQLEVDSASGQQILLYDEAITPPAALADGVTAVRLRATAAMPHPDLPKAPSEGADPAKARKGARAVARPGGTVEVPVYDRDLLRPGNRVEGLALLDASDTTILVPEGAVLTVDEHLALRIDLETTTGGGE